MPARFLNATAVKLDRRRARRAGTYELVVLEPRWGGAIHVSAAQFETMLHRQQRRPVCFLRWSGSPRTTAPGPDLPALWPSATFSVPYVGRLVRSSFVAELTDLARRERLDARVDTRSRLLSVALTVTVTGDATARERFGWCLDALVRRYSVAASVGWS